MPFLAGDLGHRALGARLPRRIWMWPVGLIGRSSGWMTRWPSAGPAHRPGSRPLSPGHRQAVAVDEAVLPQVLHQPGVPPMPCMSSMTNCAAGLQVGQEGHAVADSLEVVDGQRHVHRSRHGNEVQHGVGAAAQGHDDDHRVLERGPGHDVARLDVALQQQADGCGRLPALVVLLGRLGRGGGAIGQAHAQGLDGAGHGVGRVHAAARAGAGAAVAHDERRSVS
jgi:hypothetical protein